MQGLITPRTRQWLRGAAVIELAALAIVSAAVKRAPLLAPADAGTPDRRCRHRRAPELRSRRLDCDCSRLDAAR